MKEANHGPSLNDATNNGQNSDWLVLLLINGSVLFI